jgi:putative ABC transport system permease protein
LLLKPNADPKVLESKLPGFVEQNFKMLTAKIELYLQPLKDIHLHSMAIQYDFNHNKSDIAYVYTFTSIAFIILLIACINFMNLSTARAARRSTEVGVRKVVGAYRSQLLYQFMGESLLIATIALLVSIILIEITRPIFTALFGIVFSTNIFNDLMLLIVYIGIIMAVGILAGGYPAFVLSAFQPKETLKRFTSAGGKGENLRKLLVALQFVAAIILLTCVGIITRQMDYIQNKNLGYNKEQVLVSPMEGKIRRNFDTFRNILLQNPGITAVTASEFDVNGIPSRSVYRIEGDTKETQRMATQMYIDYDFAPFYGLEFVEGRNFSREFPTDMGESGGYIINKSLREQLGWKTAVGKKFGRIDPGSTKPDNLGTVIGVVKDFNFASLHDKIGPLYFYMDNKLFDHISIRIQSKNIQETLALIKEEWTKFAPNQPFNAHFLDEDFESMYRNEERTDKIVRTFTMLAIFVTCLGLLGLISFSAERRTKEIGIRKTLGATTRSIIVLLTKEIGWLVMIANIVAWPIAWYAMNKWLQNFAYRIEMSWWMFVLAGGLALVIALATVSWQAMRAATANPVEALRYE